MKEHISLGGCLVGLTLLGGLLADMVGTFGRAGLVESELRRKVKELAIPGNNHNLMDSIVRPLPLFMHIP
jgi:hypothetical protein